MVRGALIVCALIAPVATGAAWMLRGAAAAASVAIAVAMVLANTAIAATVLVLVARKDPLLAPAAAMPSYAFRMAGMVSAMALLRKASFIDPPVFATAFGVAVVATLWAEARVYRSTPWVAMTFLKTKETT